MPSRKLPDQTLAIVPDGAGGPEVLQIAYRTIPEPQGTQVLIKVEAAGVNRHDCNQRARGHGPKGASDVLGLEVAGQIVSVGPDADPTLIGQNRIALTDGGGYAHYCLAETGLLLPWPDGFSAVEAACLPEALFTLQLNLVHMGGIKAGDWVLLHGGSGGVASVGIAFAKLIGAHVAVTVGSEEKRTFCQELGAALAINYRTEDFAEEVLNATAGLGADIILDVVGSSYAAQNLRALAPDGRLLHLSPRGDLNLSLREIMVRRARISGALLRALPLADKLRLAEALNAMLQTGAGQDLKPVISKTFPLEEARAAHVLMEASAHMGKIVLLCSKTPAGART